MTYKVIEHDTLWKISKTLFGVGFYYSKIWSLNPYITNPHQIEPGMVLAFSLGSEKSSPEVKFGSFPPEAQRASDAESGVKVLKSKHGYSREMFSQFTEGGYPDWFHERQELINRGYYVQSTSAFTYEDLYDISALSLIEEYKNYRPPQTGLDFFVPKTFDQLGFDKSSIIRKEVQSSFYLKTFLASNIVQDLGEIHAGQGDPKILGLHDIVYVGFDPQANVAPRDQFSIYVAEGTVEHELSERKGYRYTIKGHIQVNKKKNDLWECEIIYVARSIYRHDRITVFTPRIDKMLTTFNQRNIEAVIMSSYDSERNLLSYGDLVYIDRGRADGVELGNVFTVYSFKDRHTNKQITPDPTYEVGELTVIILTENFATAVVSESHYEMSLGQLAITKTLEQVLRERKIKKGGPLKDVQQMEKEALEELDVELDLDQVENELQDQADRIELSEDELDELERQEREKSFLEEHENDRKELNRLEQEIEDAEGLLNEAVEDQNKQLEQQDLDRLEKKLKRPHPDAFESLNEIEQEVGKKYLEEDLNARDNPYGLTEFDLEEVDELLNTIPEDEGQEKAEKDEKGEHLE